MAQLIKPGSVKVITNNGEVQINITLELNVNLNSSGLQVTAQAQSVTPTKPEKTEIQEKTKSDDWLIPDFSASPKLNFGKKD